MQRCCCRPTTITTTQWHVLRKHLLLISVRFLQDIKHLMDWKFISGIYSEININFDRHCTLAHCSSMEVWRLSRLVFPRLEMNFDQVLATIGGFGRYQKLLYVWICLPQIFLAFHMMASVFTGATPPHHCWGSGMENASLTVGNLSNVNLSISLLPGHADSCSTVSGKNYSTHSTCETGWVYSHEIFQRTTVTEVNAGLRSSE